MLNGLWFRLWTWYHQIYGIYGQQKLKETPQVKNYHLQILNYFLRVNSFPALRWHLVHCASQVTKNSKWKMSTCYYLQLILNKEGSYQLTPQGGQLYERLCLFVHSFIIVLSSLTSFIHNSASGWYIFLKCFGDISAMFLDYILIIPNFLFICLLAFFLTEIRLR